MISGVAGADYSACTDGDVSGDDCMPTCATGSASTPATGFVLSCAANGEFVGHDTIWVCQGRSARCPPFDVPTTTTITIANKLLLLIVVGVVSSRSSGMVQLL